MKYKAEENTMSDGDNKGNSQHPLIKVVWIVLTIAVLVMIIGIVLTAIGEVG